MPPGARTPPAVVPVPVEPGFFKPGFFKSFQMLADRYPTNHLIH